MSTPGSSLTKSSLSAHLPRKPWQLLLIALFGLFVMGVIFTALVALILTPTLPSLESLSDSHLKVPMRVYTAEGTLIAEFGEEKRIPITIDQVPEQLIHAVLAAEDDSFYYHQGVDFQGILRAALANFRTGGRNEGASTITMQVARNYFLSPEKTYTRKLKEILLAFKIERELSKNEILELYLNKIFLGNRAYGFAAAAQVYYGKTLTELTLPEMAMLAGLPKAPSRNNPLANPESAQDRRNYVLRRMLKLHYIDAASYTEAINAPSPPANMSCDSMWTPLMSPKWRASICTKPIPKTAMPKATISTPPFVPKTKSRQTTPCARECWPTTAGMVIADRWDGKNSPNHPSPRAWMSC